MKLKISKAGDVVIHICISDRGFSGKHIFEEFRIKIEFDFHFLDKALECRIHIFSIGNENIFNDSTDISRKRKNILPNSVNPFFQGIPKAGEGIYN